jgi:hypothetical protein
MINWIVSASVVSAMVVASSDNTMAASPPQSGTYSFEIANGRISGPSRCQENPLFSYSAGGAFLFWPGLGSPGAVLRKSEGANLRITTLPTTPLASMVWQGDLTTHVFPSDSRPNTGKWNATLTFVDSSSFLLYYTLKAGGCTLTNSTVLIRTGP